MNKNSALKNASRDDLIDEILKLRKENKALEKIQKGLEKAKKSLEKENNKLKWQLKIDSQNSSKPSSTNLFSKNSPICNSRIKWQNPRWWVKWHAWNNLKREEIVDKIVDLTAKNCQKCWTIFSQIFLDNLEKLTRQVVDLNELRKYITEYQKGDVVCPDCGFLNVTCFPENVTRPVQYGSNIKAFASLLSNHWMVSLERLQQIFYEVYSLKISQETLNSCNKECFEKLATFEEKVTQALLKVEVLHADESWLRVWGKLERAHVASSPAYTLYRVHEKRGQIAMDAHNLLPQYHGILVSDHFASYKKYECLPAKCNAHHLRELDWVTDFEGKEWSGKMRQLLLKAKKLKTEAKAQEISSLEKEVLEEITQSFLLILKQGETEYIPAESTGKRGRVWKEKGHNLLLRLQGSIDATLRFIYDFRVPFDNNLAERDLRMVKLKNKVIWCFRSHEWAVVFARIRSFVSTLRKQGLSVFSALKSLFSWEIILPQF